MPPASHVNIGLSISILRFSVFLVFFYIEPHFITITLQHIARKRSFLTFPQAPSCAYVIDFSCCSLIVFLYSFFRNTAHEKLTII